MEARRERVESNDSAPAEDEAAGAGNACTSDKQFDASQALQGNSCRSVNPRPIIWLT
jgi:hypothetical protein